MGTRNEFILFENAPKESPNWDDAGNPDYPTDMSVEFTMMIRSPDNKTLAEKTIRYPIQQDNTYNIHQDCLTFQQECADKGIYIGVTND